MMQNKRWALVILVVLLALPVGRAILAAGDAIPRSLVDSAGGRVQADGLVLSNGIGQPLVGLAAARTLRLCSGYWCGASAAPIDPVETAVFLPLVVK